MIVYVVEWHSWAYENGVSGVFSSEDEAQAWINKQRGNYDYGIEPHEIDDPDWGTE